MSLNDIDTVQRALATARDAITVRRVFGEAYERNGVSVIPAARIAGGGGGSAAPGDDPDESQGKGSAGGFRVRAQPAGVFVIDGTSVRWRPAVDVNRLSFALILLGAWGVLVWGAVQKTRLGDGQRS
jgi:uncharacterized spore protein YtfJ